ncbi:PREDICTED: protein SMG8 isoform X2 [Propithecus coquereli]|uniref:protein SMG8 isoform X2 n=1 Tax=Propithecus coquereli TaxID=379532 RepID=UPI00063F4290|nr:PREDICTED: protein SMG8 isoform X2 [Propithecus coquereli]
MAGPVSLRDLLMGASAWTGSESSGGSPTEGGGSAAGGPEPPWREDEICVVGIFGKTALRLNSEKFSLVNTVCDRQVFPLFRHQDPGDPGPGISTEAGAIGEAGGAGDRGAAAGDPVRGGVAAAEGNRTEPGSQDYSLLQAYYNQESKVLYLLLTSICDNSQLLRACRALQSGEAGGGLSLPHAEAHEFWKHQEKLQCLSLLYLFSVCHILLLVHPTCSFDITYDRVFRALDGLRQKVLPLLKTAIKDCPVGKDWKLNCRPCPPRLLFLFQLNGALKVEPPRNQDPAHPDKPKKHSPKRRLQHALEDQIYRIFRKSRVLTNQSINCLFTVPANQAFVYIVPGSQEEDPVGEKPEADRNPPVLYHNSRARSTGACNCGRKQAPRDDPFDIKAANYDFYQLLEEKCCGKLDHINFPVFEPSTPDPAPAKNESSPAPPDSDADKLKEKEPQTQGESTSLSLALSLGQSTDSLGTYPADPQAGGDNPEIHGQGEVKTEKRPNLVDRQASTVEYLPGMLHSNCPKGLLPKFSSWSLVKLGPAKSYNFHTGLDQQGFIPGTNYLMPWDIVIRTRAEDEGDLDTNSWPAPNKAIPGKRSAVVMGRGRRRDDIARAFVGFEYEDSRGRRFMCSGPEKVMKVMGSGPKESALKALNSDMPLYILSSSQGRGLKPHYAQLMRLFVVVPDAPLQIILMPQVQPGPPPCPVFYPEKQEITLPPDGLWVLRFPYSYVTERGPCFPPKENVQLMSYKVLRGVLKAVTQ